MKFELTHIVAMIIAVVIAIIVATCLAKRCNNEPEDSATQMTQTSTNNPTADSENPESVADTSASATEKPEADTSPSA